MEVFMVERMKEKGQSRNLYFASAISFVHG